MPTVTIGSNPALGTALTLPRQQVYISFYAPCQATPMQRYFRHNPLFLYLIFNTREIFYKSGQQNPYAFVGNVVIYVISFLPLAFFRKRFIMVIDKLVTISRIPDYTLFLFRYFTRKGLYAMKFSYYPGCTLRNKAKDLDTYARASAKALGFELEEIADWQCCGGVYPLGADEIASKLSSVRALAAAAEKGQDLVTLCSACHHVIKRVNDDMKNVEDIRLRANNYMKLSIPYEGQTKVLHFLEVLRDMGFDKLKEKVVNPLTGKKIGAYYGCLLLRPNKVMAFDDPENPQIIEDFIRALGAEPIIYPYRNECCGGYISLKEPQMAKNMSQTIAESAQSFGAQMLITACPLCRYNLNKSQENLPVYYFTELLAEALGVKEEALK